MREDYPQFFRGLFAVALAWQVALLVIGSNPVRFRPLMIPAVIEKMGYVASLVVLYTTGRISALEFQPVLPDFVLGVR